MECIVVNDNYLGDKFKVVSIFKFYEAKEILGEGKNGKDYYSLDDDCNLYGKPADYPTKPNEKFDGKW